MYIVVLLLSLLFVTGNVQYAYAQALDRTHVNYRNPLAHGSSCDSTTLNAALAAVDAGADNETVVLTRTDRAKVPCTWTFTDAVTVSNKVTFVVPDGVQINANGNTFTMNGRFIGEGTSIFTTTDTVAFGDGSVQYVNPLWWGSTYDNVTIAAMLTALGSAVTHVLMPKGTWLLAANVTFPATMLVSIPYGAVLRPALATTLTLNSCPKAGRYQIVNADESTSGAFRVVGCDVVLPEWYAVVGDGTTDDTALLNITIAASANMVVLLGNKTYGTSSPLSMVSNVTLRGESWKSVVKAIDFSTPFSLIATNNVAISNAGLESLTLDGNRAGNAGVVSIAGVGGIWQHSHITNVHVTGMTTHGIELSGTVAAGVSTANIVKHNYVEDWGQASGVGVGIFLFRGAADNIVDGNVLRGTFPSVGISTDDWSSSGESITPVRNKIINNNVYGDTDRLANGIGSTAHDEGQVLNNTVTNTVTGIRALIGSAGSNGNTNLIPERLNIGSNTVIDFSTNGIQNRGDDVNIHDNTIVNEDTASAGTGVGIVYGSASGNTVATLANNTIHSVATAIQVVQGDRLTITGGTVDGATTGIDVDGSVDTVAFASISGVYFTGVTGDVVALGADTRDSVVQGNIIRCAGGTVNQITLGASTTRNVIRDNTWLAATAISPALIDIDSGSASNIAFNNFTPNPTTFVALDTTATPYIANADAFTVAASGTAVTGFTGKAINKVFELRFTGARTITDGATLHLNGGVNFVGSADDLLTLKVGSGGNVYEVSRSVN